ncbi:MAG: TonB-dependent receptor [Acidiphilium sp.]|nr:TonB-dependent receptor [Acidiphilium sp.]MDD4936697.1 TonB-dependent receptor [Acidiphilium sp.]
MNVKYNRFRSPAYIIAAVCGVATVPLAQAQTAQPSPSGGQYGAGNAPTVNAGLISASAKHKASSAKTFETEVLSHKAIFNAPMSLGVITKRQLRALAPNMGGTQALTLLPNVTVTGYNPNNAGGRATISMRGVQVGYNSLPGNLESNGITALFDGVPVNNVIRGTALRTTELPIGALLAGVNVAYGPGSPETRWFDSLGGTINFIPIQPTKKPSAKVSLSYGSFGSRVASAAASTGDFDKGWSAVFAYSISTGHTYRTPGFEAPSQLNQTFIKLQDHYASGRISLGAYVTRNSEYRPNLIPTNPISSVTINGYGQPGQIYSQPTSGFYSALPYNTWHKRIVEGNDIIYGRIHQQITDRLRLIDLVWYRNGNTHRVHINLGFPPDNTSGGVVRMMETSKTFGDRLTFVDSLPDNEVSFGGYYLYADSFQAKYHYGNTAYNFNNPADVIALSANHDYNTYATAFIQDKITPFAGFDILPGVQVGSYSVRYNDDNPSELLLYPNAAPNTNTNPNLGTSYTRWAPSIGVNYKPIGWLSLFANAAKTTKVPQAENFDNQQEEVNSLRPIGMTDYEFGFKILKRDVADLKKIYLGVDYFHEHMTNETLTFSPADNPFYTEFAYATESLSGVDANLAVDLRDGMSGFANAGYLHGYYPTYLNTAPTIPVYDNGVPVVNVPNITFNVGLRYRHYIGDGNAVHMAAYDQYIGSQHMFNANTNAPSHRTFGGYNIVNLNVGDRVNLHRMFGLGPDVANVQFQVTNLFNRQYNSAQYISSGGYFSTNRSGYILADPGVPRSFFLSISLKYG